MSQNKTAVSKATAKHRPTGWGRGHSRESPCYRTEDISLAKAAELAGVSWQRMRESLLSRGVQLQLGSETKEEALEEVVGLRRHRDADGHPGSFEGHVAGSTQRRRLKILLVFMPDQTDAQSSEKGTR